MIFQDFQEEFRTLSMFKEKKLLIIKNVFSNSHASLFKEKFLKRIEEFKNSNNVIVFYEEANVPKNDSLFKILNKQAKSQEFSFLKGEKLKSWARKEFANYGKKICPQALNQLVYYVGKDLWRFSNEIKKLVSYKLKCKDIEISSRDLDFLIRPNIETDIFKTIDAMALRNRKQALYFIHKHLEKGDYPLYLLTMINFQFRNLLLIKARHQYTNNTPMTRINDISKKLGMHPYVVRKTLGQAEKFSFIDLKKIYRKIFQADLDIKTGKIEPETALDLLIAEI